MTSEKKGDVRFDRQERIIGVEAMEELKKQRVLLVGLGGLGAEIAKNIILMGIQSVTLHDDQNATWNDLSSQFMLSEDSIGKNRLSESLKFLKDLNETCEISELKDKITEDVIKKFTVVIYTEKPYQEVLDVADLCHNNGVKFICSMTAGVYSTVFVDFGKEFISKDIGLEENSGIVTKITVDEKGIGEVNIEDEENQTEHTMTDQYSVTFGGIEGMVELNGQTRKIERTGPFTFKIGDVSKLSTYKKGGYWSSLPVKQTITFDSLRDSLKKPKIVYREFEKDYNNHTAFLTLGEFLKKHNRYPKPYNKDDCKEFLNLASSVCKEYSLELDEKYLTKFSFTCSGNLNPTTTFMGAVVAQETLKACTLKYLPIEQFFYFDAIETLPDPYPEEDECKPENNRYDGMIAVFGTKFQDIIGNKKSFIVGAGALGCEYIKNYALMGISCGPKGKTYVTDLDIIDVSNLSRQFLFRKEHVGKMKSLIASETAVKINPSFNVVHMTDRVGPETEHIFNDKFWDSLDFITNALDNVQARLYTDSKCIYYKKALLESGTLGSMANSQTILPYETLSYASYKDAAQKAIAKCTIHTFPNLIQHTIAWAKEMFDTIFNAEPTEVQEFLKSPQKFIEKNDQNFYQLETVFQFLKKAPSTFDQCIEKARIKFEEEFTHKIKSILEEFPKDKKTEKGDDFWSGNKRCPTIPIFDFKVPNHQLFILSTAKLYADIYGIKIPENISLEKYQEICEKTKLPEYTKKPVDTGKKEEKKEIVQLTEEQVKNQLEYLRKMKEYLLDEKWKGFKAFIVEFEKDQDSNMHIDFVTSSSNVRATAYGIPEADKHKTKGIAGNIIPAMITTTALITGIVGYEILKILQGKKRDSMRNAFVNIAVNTSLLAPPTEATKSLADRWTIWDRFDISEGRDITIKEFVELLKTKYDLEIVAFTFGPMSFIMSMTDEEILKMNLGYVCNEIYKKGTNKNFSKDQKYVELFIQGRIDKKFFPLPSVKYQFRFDVAPVKKQKK